MFVRVNLYKMICLSAFVTSMLIFDGRAMDQKPEVGSDESHLSQVAPVTKELNLEHRSMFEEGVAVNFYIDHVSRENAEGKIAEIYQKFPAQVMVPGPVLIKSKDPKLSEMNANELFYFASHKTISLKVMAAIRYILAVHVKSAYCTNVNGKVLFLNGLTEDMLLSLQEGESCECFTEKENALIKFAVKATMSPEKTNAVDIDSVKSVGWKDEELLAAVVNGIDSVAGINVFKAFSVKEN